MAGPVHSVSRDVVVIGGSAGAIPVLQQILGGLDAAFPAAVLIVVHQGQDPPGALPETIRRGPLPVAHAVDGDLPVEDGYSLIRRVRDAERRAKTARVPAVALTAFARDEDRDKALKSGFDRHLSKPVDVEHLVPMLLDLKITPG